MQRGTSSVRQSRGRTAVGESESKGARERKGGLVLAGRGAGGCT